MAKTYTPVGWSDGIITSPAVADLETGVVTPPVVEGTTPINATNLNHMDEAIKELYDGGATSKDIVIGTETDITEDTKILIESSDTEEAYDVLKYNDKGDFKNIKLPPIGDTLPVGTIVEIPDDMFVPDGYELIEDKIFNVLWTNPNPANNFVAQNVVLSSNDYDYLMISYEVDTNIMKTKIIPKGYGCELTRVVYSDGMFLHRRVMTYVNDTTCSFSSATLNGNERNWLCKPTKIIGIKLK